MAQIKETYFKSYKEFIKRLGKLDNFIETRELAFHVYRDMISKSIVKSLHKDQCVKYGIHCDIQKVESKYSFGLYILSVYYAVNKFFYEFQNEHPNLTPRDSATNIPMLKHLIQYIPDWSSSDRRCMLIDVFNYYKGFRDDFFHPNSSVSEKKLANALNKHSDAINKEFSLGLPNKYNELDLKDFYLFSRISKQIAKELCQLLPLSLQELLKTMVSNDYIIKKTKTITSKTIEEQKEILTRAVRSVYSIPIEDAQTIASLLLEKI